MDGGSTPPAPDYVGAANATAQGNLTNLNAQTVANRPNQVTPWGTSTWTQTPTIDQAGYDAALKSYQAGNQQGTWVPPTAGSYSGGGEGGGDMYMPGTAGYWSGASSNGAAAPNIKDFTTNNWTQNLTLTPAEQEALTNQQNIQKNQSSLAQTLQGQVASTMAGGFQAPQLSDYMTGVGSVNQSFGQFNPSGVGGVNQQQLTANLNGVQGVNQNLNTTGTRVNTNTPQFSDAQAKYGAQAAYNAQVDLLRPQMDQDTQHLDNQLRLQGLGAGGEAYNSATQNLQRTQAQTLTQAANNAVQTGNNEANQNYASQLAGYGAQNTAIGQQYGQNLNTFNANNTARNSALQNALGAYQANLQGQSAYNTAQNQAYGQALAGYGANTSAQQASNQAQQQAYSQGQNSYGTAYTAALQNYLQPLNNMNAVLNGNQVSMPNMPGFATAGYTAGADQSGATGAQGSWNQGIYNSNQAAASSTNAAGAGAIAAIAAAFI